MATQTHGNQTTISWNNHIIGGLTSIGGVEITSGDLDVTTLNDSFKKAMQDLPEAADIAISGYFDPTDTNGQVAMLADMTSRTPRDVEIAIAGSAAIKWTFEAYLKLFKTGDFTNAVIPFSATLKPTGNPLKKPTLTVSGS